MSSRIFIWEVITLLLALCDEADKPERCEIRSMQPLALKSKPYYLEPEHTGVTLPFYLAYFIEGLFFSIFLYLTSNNATNFSKPLFTSIYHHR